MASHVVLWSVVKAMLDHCAGGWTDKIHTHNRFFLALPSLVWVGKPANGMVNVHPFAMSFNIPCPINVFRILV